MTAAPTATSMQTHLGASAREWGLTGLSGQKIHKNRVEEYSGNFARGDVIGVHVDLN